MTEGGNKKERGRTYAELRRLLLAWKIEKRMNFHGMAEFAKIALKGIREEMGKRT